LKPATTAATASGNYGNDHHDESYDHYHEDDNHHNEYCNHHDECGYNHYSHYPPPPPLTLPTTTHTTHHHHAQANDVNPDLARQACCGLANLAEMMENQNIIMRNGGCKLLIKALDNPSVLVRREASR